MMRLGGSDQLAGCHRGTLRRTGAVLAWPNRLSTSTTRLITEQKRRCTASATSSPSPWFQDPNPANPPPHSRTPHVVAAAALCEDDLLLRQAPTSHDALAAPLRSTKNPQARDAGERLQGNRGMTAAAARTLEVREWLMELGPFKGLALSDATAVAKLVRERHIPAGETLQQAGEPPSEFIVLRSGSLNVQEQPVGGSSASTAAGTSTLATPGSAYHWCEVILRHPARAALRASGEDGATIWTVPAVSLRALVAKKPHLAVAVSLRLSQEMALSLGEAASAVKEREMRYRALEPYLVRSPKFGVIGSSKYADRLRKQVVAAARDPLRGPVLVVGEAGMCPDHVATLIHYASTMLKGPMAEVDCARILKEGELLSKVFGRGSFPGLLHWLGQDGTLLINNAHMAPPGLITRLQQLIQQGTYQPLSPLASGDEGATCPPAMAERECRTRLLLAAEMPVPSLSGLLTVITVPPLRLRPADAVDMQRFFLRRASRLQADGAQLELTKEAERHIQAYGFPGGKTELEASVIKAVSSSRLKASNGNGSPDASMTSPASSTVSVDAQAAAQPALALSRDDFWGVGQVEDRFKIDLLSAMPWLRSFLRSDVWPEGINHGFTKYVFVVMILGLVLGPQDREYNGFLNIFWDWWWPGIFLVYPFFGRIWCSVCPFMIWGQVAQRWRTSMGVKLAKWPKDAMESWGVWFMFGLFAGILVWEEVWDLPHSGVLSAALLLLITAGAVTTSMFFEKRMWCRYLCPIGGMNGLMAKLSMVEIRGRQGVCSANCSTYSCIKGGPAVGEGLQTDGCPMAYHSAQLPDNSFCVQCMNCLKACPNGSVEIRLRPPGFDLWTNHVPHDYEASLMFMLLGAAYMHRLPNLAVQLGMPLEAVASKPAHILASVAVLAAPGLITWAVDAANRAALRLAASAAPAPQIQGGAAAAAPPLPPKLPAPFLQLVYGYVPLVWGLTLATYENQLMGQGGTFLQAFAHTVGASGLAPYLPVVAAGPTVIEFVQGSTLIVSSALSLAMMRKLGAAPWSSLLPHALLIAAFTMEMWHVL